VSLRQRLEDIARRALHPHHADPARFNDAVALRTEWTPLRIGGASIRTHRLVEKGPGRLEFRAGPPWRLLLFGFGTGVFALALGGIASVVPVAIVALVAIGALFFLRPAVFDRGIGQYWIGWGPPPPGTESATAGRLNDVYALQLLGEHIPRSEGSSYRSYELNLVMRSGARRSIVDHGEAETLRQDAQRLARFLSCRLWDATDAAARAPTVAGGMPTPHGPSTPSSAQPPAARPSLGMALHPLRVLFGALGQVIGALFVLSLLLVFVSIYVVTQQPEALEALVRWLFGQIAAAELGA
jgi:hypothetical protein